MKFNIKRKDRSMNKKITIVTVCFNASETIKNTIESVRKGKSALVVASESVSDGTKKLINDKTAYYKTVRRFFIFI